MSKQSGGEALNDLVRSIHGKLLQMAAALQWNRNATTGPEALVNETYLKLAPSSSADRRDPEKFLQTAAAVMRNILIDAARRKKAEKHGGSVLFTSADPEQPDDWTADQFLTINQALERLAVHSPRQAKVVEWKFYWGCTIQETATALDISENTVERDWNSAKKWLANELGG